RASAGERERPEHPCVGTNALNLYNITPATPGPGRYRTAAHEKESRPSIAVARDTRHLPAAAADQAAKVATGNACDAFRFVEPRSTPELSFAVRHLGAGAGIVLTASHNPPPDNGYKVYWNDGAQVVEPHASGIIDEVNAIVSESYEPVPESERGIVTDL